MSNIFVTKVDGKFFDSVCVVSLVHDYNLTFELSDGRVINHDSLVKEYKNICNCFDYSSYYIVIFCLTESEIFLYDKVKLVSKQANEYYTPLSWVYIDDYRFYISGDALDNSVEGLFHTIDSNIMRLFLNNDNLSDTGDSYTKVLSLYRINSGDRFIVEFSLEKSILARAKLVE